MAFDDEDAVRKTSYCCATLCRVIIFLLGSGGIVCSGFAAISCDFFTYKVEDASELLEPFTNVTQAHVGLFSFQVKDTEISFDELDAFKQNFERLQEGECLEYGDQFHNSQFNTLFISAQFCSLIAPCLAILAWSLNLLELMCCRIWCSYFLATNMFFSAFIAQGCTFMIFGQKEFCFSSDLEDCKVQEGAYLSMASAGCYLISSLILCCMPLSKPLLSTIFCCCGGGNRNRSASEDEKNNNNNNGTFDDEERQATEPQVY